MAFSFGKTVITDGLIDYLDIINPSSYPGSGTTIYDLSRNNLSGSLVNGPTYDTTYGGNITCDGVNDYIQLTDVNVTSFTVSVVYSPLAFDTNTATARYNSPFETDSGGIGSMFLRYNATNSSSSMVIANHNSGSFGQLQLAVTHSLNQVYDATITYNDTTKLVSAYFNGVFNNSLTFTTNLKYTGVKQLGYTFNCRIFNYRLYNRVLSTTEILQNYNAIKGRYGQ
jgi:hypothetical protein